MSKTIGMNLSRRALFSFRSGKQKSTKFTPFDVMFRRPPIQTEGTEICYSMPLHQDDLASSVTDLMKMRNDKNKFGEGECR